jgi:hypothetical protein
MCQFLFIQVTLQLSGWTTSKSEQFTQPGQPLSCSVYLHKFLDRVWWNKIFYKHGSYSIVHSCNITCVSAKTLTYMTLLLLPEHFTKKNIFNRWEVLRQTLRIIYYISKSKKYFHKYVTKYLVLNYYSFLGHKGTALVTELYWCGECSKKCFSLNRYEYCILSVLINFIVCIHQILGQVLYLCRKTWSPPV